MALAAGVRGWWRPLLGTVVVLGGAVLAAFAVFAGSEITGAVLATVHNVAYFLDLMADLRQAIESGRSAARAAELPALA